MIRFAFVVAVLVAGLSIASIASAGPGKPKPHTVSASDSITLMTADPALGKWLTFSYVLVENVKSPRIQVICSQNGTVVYGEAGPATQSFLLGGASSLWLNDPARRSQPASCVATLYSWDFTPVQVFIPYAWTPDFTAAGKP